MVGTRAENAGFLYRRRADSMLADADRMSQQIIDTIRRKHRSLYSEATAWSFFIQEFRPLLVANADGTATALSTDANRSAVDEQGLAVEISDLYQHFFHVYPPKFILYPLSKDAPGLGFDLKLLKRLVLCSDDERLLFLEADGTASARRSGASVWGALRVSDVMMGAPLPDELKGHPLVSWLLDATRLANGEPIYEPARRYSGPGSFRIEQFLRDMSQPTVENQVREDVVRPRCLLIHGSAGIADRELLDALSDAYELTAVSLDDLDHERVDKDTIYRGADPLSKRRRRA
jgi:hypothetical protein